jgi:Rieske Fe-S protein
MTEGSRQDRHASRRVVLLGVGVAGVGALAGCSTAFVPFDAGEDGKPADNAGVVATESHDAGAGVSSSPSASASASPSASKTKAAKTTASGDGSTTNGTLLGDVSEIPVGEGKIFAAEKVVVTQPTQGTYKAFSAVCTHLGCILDQVENGNIYCPCHGAIFSVSNGAAVAGPTTIALPVERITVTDGKITLE